MRALLSDCEPNACHFGISVTALVSRIRDSLLYAWTYCVTERGLREVVSECDACNTSGVVADVLWTREQKASARKIGFQRFTSDE